LNIYAIGLLVNLIIQVFSAGIFIGGLIFTIKFLQQQLKTLSEKQDKYNNYLERLIKVESSTSSAHKRLDEIREEKLHEAQTNI